MQAVKGRSRHGGLIELGTLSVWDRRDMDRRNGAAWIYTYTYMRTWCLKPERGVATLRMAGQVKRRGSGLSGGSGQPRGEWASSCFGTRQGCVSYRICSSEGGGKQACVRHARSASRRTQLPARVQISHGAYLTRKFHHEEPGNSAEQARY